METEVLRKSFTVDEYYRMGAAGIFGKDARLDLIEGEIIEMSPVVDWRIGCVTMGKSFPIVTFTVDVMFG